MSAGPCDPSCEQLEEMQAQDGTRGRIVSEDRESFVVFNSNIFEIAGIAQEDAGEY